DHGIYANNNTPVKYIEDNIIFNNQAYGLHAYASAGQYINNFTIRGNTAFNNGTITSLGWRPDLFVGGATSANGIVVDQNYTFRNDNGISVSMGYSAQNGSLALTNNYFVGKMEILRWSSVNQSGTTL